MYASANMLATMTADKLLAVMLINKEDTWNRLFYLVLLTHFHLDIQNVIDFCLDAF